MFGRAYKRQSVRKPTVSVIVPTLNEAKNLPLVLPYIPLDVVDEVILVDGRSKDSTIAVAKQLLPSLRVALENTPGKGAALRRGYREARGDILVVLDADGSNDPREIPRYVQALVEGADFAKGSRFAPSGGTTDMPRLRKMGNMAFVLIVNLLFSESFTDLCYGYHAFWRHTLEQLDLESVDGFEVDTSIYLQAVRKKLRVVDVPSFEGFRFYGMGKLQTFPDGWRVLRTIFQEWAAKMRQPPLEPTVGFRSYARKAGLREGSYIPMTILDLYSSAPKRDGDINGCQCSYGLDDFLCRHWPRVAKHDSRRLLHGVLLTIMEEMGATGGSLVVLDDQNQVTQGYRIFGRNIAPIQSGDMDDTLTRGVTGWAVENRKPLIIPNTRADPRWVHRSWEDEEGAHRTAMVVPYMVNEKLVCVLALTRPADRPFTQANLERLNAMPISVTMKSESDPTKSPEAAGPTKRNGHSGPHHQRRSGS
ncbi:MAG: glycosyltransferase [Chloroflexi bacterium]|nr:glycosyltransferase [Chloroflexota bacterium]